MTTDVLPSATIKSSLCLFLKVIGVLALLSIIIYAIYWVTYLRGIDFKKIHLLITREAYKFSGSEAEVETIVLKGVDEIVASPHLLSQARTFAKQSNIDLEQYLVDLATAMAINYGYLKIKPGTSYPPPPPPPKNIRI